MTVKRVYNCENCGYAWESVVEPDTNLAGEYVCDRCDGEGEEE